jgi:hypothetical protein
MPTSYGYEPNPPPSEVSRRGGKTSGIAVPHSRASVRGHAIGPSRASRARPARAHSWAMRDAAVGVGRSRRQRHTSARASCAGASRRGACAADPSS